MNILPSREVPLAEFNVPYHSVNLLFIWASSKETFCVTLLCNRHFICSDYNSETEHNVSTPNGMTEIDKWIKIPRCFDGWHSHRELRNFTKNFHNFDGISMISATRSPCFCCSDAHSLSCQLVINPLLLLIPYHLC